jgi:RNA polymerase sigma-70 factor (ECF subfamily)
MSAATAALGPTAVGRAQGPVPTNRLAVGVGPRACSPAALAESRETRAESFEALVRTHQDRLYGFAYRLAGNRDDAEDLFQQSLIEAYAAFDRFEIGSHFDRWVCRIMHHTFLDTVRRRPRWAIESLDTAWERIGCAGEIAPREVPDPRGGPEIELMEKTLSEPLQRALDALPADFRSVVVLADMQELSYEEVARFLGCPVGTVRSRLHRARNMLRRALIGEAERQTPGARRGPRARHWSEGVGPTPLRRERRQAA